MTAVGSIKEKLQVLGHVREGLIQSGVQISVKLDSLPLDRRSTEASTKPLFGLHSFNPDHQATTVGESRLSQW